MSNLNRQLIVVDIGNSSIKVGVPAEAKSWKLNWSGQIDQLPVDSLLGSSADWWICSVNQTKLNSLKSWLETNRPADTVQIVDHAHISIAVEVDFPQRVGIDRLVAAQMASVQYPGQDLVVVDAGTAVTIDAFADGKFVGGTISPGSQIEFQSLLEKADQLPLIEGRALPDSVIGKSTEAAIQAGVMLGQVGSITYLVSEINKLLNTPQVVVTGGGIMPLQKRLPDSWHYVPTLVLDGVRMIAVDSEPSSQE